MAEAVVETGASFPVANSERWVKHKVGLDIDYVQGHIDGKAAEKFEELSLLSKILVVRGITELSVCKFRETSGDPSYHPNQYGAWLSVIQRLIGSEGIERLGI